MPNASSIVNQLAHLANEFNYVAAAWHAAFLVGLAAIATGLYKPTKRGLARLLALPVASVAAFAWYAENPFNGAIFALLALTMLLLAQRHPPSAITRAAPSVTVVSALLFAFALGYPHFVRVDASWKYALFAPLGVVPCPTLAFVTASSLLWQSFGSRPWALVVGISSSFYALFGLLALDVWIDVGLLVASCLLLARVPAPLMLMETKPAIVHRAHALAPRTAGHSPRGRSLRTR